MYPGFVIPPCDTQLRARVDGVEPRTLTLAGMKAKSELTYRFLNQAERCLTRTAMS